MTFTGHRLRPTSLKALLENTTQMLMTHGRDTLYRTFSRIIHVVETASWTRRLVENVGPYR